MLSYVPFSRTPQFQLSETAVERLSLPHATPIDRPPIPPSPLLSYKAPPSPSPTPHRLPPPMDKYTFIRNGALRLPPGFRFHPTDEELVVQYLKKKVFSHPLPASIIPEFDLCKADPWDLPGNCQRERYFFSKKESKYRNGSRSNRATSSGYWKATGIDKQIMAYKTNQLVGMKKTLVFYKGKPPRGSRTDWIMHEYRLDSEGEKENWVLCRIFMKRRASNGDFVRGGVGSPVFHDFLDGDESDSASSGLTEVSRDGDEVEESNSFSSFNPSL